MDIDSQVIAERVRERLPPQLQHLCIMVWPYAWAWEPIVAVFENKATGRNIEFEIQEDGALLVWQQACLLDL